MTAQPRLLVAHVAILVVAAVSLGVALVLLGYRLESPLVVLCLALAVCCRRALERSDSPRQQT